MENKQLTKLLQTKSERVRMIPKVGAKSDVWKRFSLIHLDGQQVQGVCACNSCFNVFVATPSAGTNHLKRHLSSCSRFTGPKQLTLTQSFPVPISTFNRDERFSIKSAEAAFCFWVTKIGQTIFVESGESQCD